MKHAILEHIPYGRENAIKREELCARMQTSDRSMRGLIEEARRDDHIIINDQTGAGYYRPTADDLESISAQYWQDTHRALSILARRKAARKILKQAGRPV